MGSPSRNGASNRYHFPQLGPNGLCTKFVKPHKSGSIEPCGQGRDGSRHLYYPCRVGRRCHVKSWSIEQRLNHESEHSR